MKSIQDLVKSNSKPVTSQTASEATARAMIANSHDLLAETAQVDWVSRLLSSTSAKNRTKQIIDAAGEAAKQYQTTKSELGKEVAMLQIRAQHSISEARLLADHHDQISSIKEAADNEFISQAIRSLAEKKLQLEAIRAMNVDPELAAEVEKHVIATFHGNVNKHLGQTIEY